MELEANEVFPEEELMEPRKVLGLLPSILVPVCSYLDRQDLLESRLVCRRWKLAVDHLAKLEIDLQIKLNLLGNQRTFQDLDFFTSTKIQQFLADMSTYNANPFVGRAIRLVYSSLYSEEDYPEVFWNAAKQLLKRFGRDIHEMFLISEGDEDQTGSEIAENFLSLLTLMPELRTLQIEIKNENYDGYVAQEINLDNIKPFFEHLKCINLFKMSNLAANTWLEAIHKMCYHPGKVINICLTNDFHPNLKLMYPNLEIIDKYEQHIFDSDAHPRRRIKLEFQESFSVFPQFADTITTIQLGGYFIVKKSLLKSLQLPNLRKLSFCRIECDTFDFLTQFDSLEELETRKIEFHSPRGNSAKDYFYKDTFFKTEKEENSYDFLPKEVKILPFVSKYLEMTDFPQLRLVSHAWKEAVDRVAEHEQLSGEDNRDFPFQEYKFSREEEIQDFFEKMENHSGNPFVGRNVNICRGYSEGNSREFRNLVLNLLDMFGQYINKLTLGDRGGTEYDTNFMEVSLVSHRIMNVLKLTPNLKVLIVKTWLEGMNDAESSDIVYPTLQHLQSLNVSTKSQAVLGTVHKMCCYPERVTNLTVGMPYSSELAVMFPNVEVFSATFYKKEDFVSLKDSGWPLKTLVIIPGSLLKLDEVALHIQHFQDTLTSLSILNGVVIHRDVHLGLPHLKELKLTKCKTRSLEIFLELPALNRMQIDVFHYKRQGKFIRMM